MRAIIKDRGGEVVEDLQLDGLREVIVFAYQKNLHLVGWIDPHDETRFTRLQVRALRVELEQIITQVEDEQLRQTAQELCTFIEPAERAHRFLHFR